MEVSGLAIGVGLSGRGRATSRDVPYWPTDVLPARMSAALPAYFVLPLASQGGVSWTDLAPSSSAQMAVTTVARQREMVEAWSKVMFSGICCTAMSG